MYQTRENLDILFRKTMPEIVLENIRAYKTAFASYRLEANASAYAKNTFEHYAYLNLMQYSISEVEMRYRALMQEIDDNGYKGIFEPICSYADKILRLRDNVLSIDATENLNWNSITRRLGQDLFTTAWLANRDIGKQNAGKHEFIWPAILKTDDRKLNAILQKGLAENHCHLHGSTQSFPLSWACLMNHPDFIWQFVEAQGRFSENLNFNISRGVSDNVMPWDKRLLYAAMIRVLLYERCIDIRGNEEIWEEFQRFDRFPTATQVKCHVQVVRYNYGVKWEQCNQRKKCLDYACCQELYQVNETHYNRLLAGERSFLYHCFKNVFQGKFTRQEASLFYLYLLIKSNFRSELIQVNKRTGFENFLEYQNRKNQFFGNLDEYWTESQRLSVVAGSEENHLVSMETRIMPKNTAEKLRNSIRDLDRRARFAISKEQPLPHYYVIHFAKRPFELDKNEMNNRRCPRNYKERNLAKKGAIALVKYMERYDRKEPRVYGIDACSLEIGCRPETFATEFRYIRGCIRKGAVKHLDIGITHHAGEDFLDIVDGIRAIDESIRFMGMERYDRIGHALALGINAQDYYAFKKQSVFMPKQDYLDNLVWILYRSFELGVEINGNMRARLEKKAGKLLYEIYPGAEYDYNVLDAYYSSWKLRGDHPDLYREGKCNDAIVKKNMTGLYEKYMKCGDEDELDGYRNNNKVAELYYRYHFDDEAKKKGSEIEEIRFEEVHIQLVEEMQEAMRREICKQGICIECNPSSNVLIGTFRHYDKHPILTFNSNCLDRSKVETPNISVSINTDDLGVFDTSLENEYALMLRAVIRQRNAEGNYDDDAVYEYLDYIRESGIQMAFKKRQNDLR